MLSYIWLNTRKMIKILYNFYVITSIYMTNVVLELKKADDQINYDSIVGILYKCKILIDTFGEDFLDSIDIKYIVRNISKKMSIIISVILSNFRTNTKLYYYRSIDFFEREIWDMYGIIINNHYNLSRILSEYGFMGFAFRKEFPLTGFLELFYNGEYKTVTSCNLFLEQDFNYYENNNWLF